MASLLTLYVATDGDWDPRDRQGGERRSFNRRLMDALEELDVFDVNFSGEIRTGPLEMSFLVMEDDFGPAVRHGVTAVRSAIHAAGGYTADWPNCDHVPEPECSDADTKTVRFFGTSEKPVVLTCQVRSKRPDG